MRYKTTRASKLEQNSFVHDKCQVMSDVEKSKKKPVGWSSL